MEGNGGPMITAQSRGHKHQRQLEAGIRSQLDRPLVVTLKSEVVAVGDGWDEHEGLISGVIECDVLTHPATQLTLHRGQRGGPGTGGGQRKVIPELSHKVVVKHQAGKKQKLILH